MRILHCLRAPVGGLFRHVLDLAAEQAANGHEVGIVADRNAEDALTESKFQSIAAALKIGIARIGMARQPGLGDYRAYKAVLKHVRPLNLDVLHGHGAKGGAYARLCARKLKREGQSVGAFYTPHGGSLNFKPGTFQSRVFMKLETVLEASTQGLIFESAYAARIYEQRVGPINAPFRVIPNGLKAADFDELPLAEKATDFLFIGELRDIKGVDVMLKALAGLQSERRVTATIVGSGPDAERLHTIASELGLTQTAIFTGAMPAREALRLGRVMVVPSLAESFPYVVLEAAAAARPLISTSVGGIPEIVADTDTYLVEAGNVVALRTAMAGAIAQPEVALARAGRLKDNVQRKFTAAGMAKAVEQFYAFTKI